MGTHVLWDINGNYPKERVGAKHGAEINKDSTGFSLRNLQNPQYVKVHCTAPGGALSIELFPGLFGRETLVMSTLGEGRATEQTWALARLGSSHIAFR